MLFENGASHQFVSSKSAGFVNEESGPMSLAAMQQVHTQTHTSAHPNYQDLAPQVLRQRLVVEGYPARPITDADIKDYLCKLSDFIGMRTLLAPVTHCSDLYGWAGWIHWETSGAHFYAWERPLLFFSVDIYSCKAFEVQSALDLTQRYFQTTKLCHKSF